MIRDVVLGGTRRPGKRTAAVLALNGAPTVELRDAWAHAEATFRSSILVAVDGGLRSCRRLGRAPDLFVGDADSVTRPPRGVAAVTLATDKDLSDLAAALGELRRRVQVILVAGLVGGRLDHEWANLQELGAHARWFDGMLSRSRRGMVVVTADRCRVTAARGQVFSLLPLGAAATVTLRGARWRLDRERLRPGSRGLSNLARGRVALTVHSGAVALVLPVGRLPG